MTTLETAITTSQRLRPRTREMYLQSVHNFFTFVGGSAESHWTVSNVERWRDDMLQRTAPQTVNGHLAGLRYASKRRSLSCGLPDFASPVEKAQTGGLFAPVERNALTHAQAAAILATCDDSLEGVRARAILLLGLRAALRREGIASLKVGCFDPATGVLKDIQLKGGRRHRIKLDPQTAAAVTTWLKLRKGAASDPMFVGFTRPQMDLKWQPGFKKQQLTPTTVYNIVVKHAELAGIPDVYTHILRHTCITWLSEAGVSKADIRRLTGLSSDAMVDRYTHSTSTDAVSSVLPEIE